MESPRRTALARPRGLARPFDEKDEGDGSGRGGRVHEDARRLGEHRESGEKDGDDGGRHAPPEPAPAGARGPLGAAKLPSGKRPAWAPPWVVGELVTAGAPGGVPAGGRGA